MKTKPFVLSEYLDNEEAIQEYFARVIHVSFYISRFLQNLPALPGSGLSARVFELRRRDARAPMSRFCKNLISKF